MYTSDQFRPVKYAGITYKPRGDGGMLVLYDHTCVRIYVNGPSELPWASEKTKEKPRWVRTRGGSTLDFAMMLRRIRRHELHVQRAVGTRRRVREPARVKAYSAFLAHIDPAHLAEISDIPLRAFNYYSAIRRCPGLFDIACSGKRDGGLAGGAGLAYALSNAALLIQPRPRRPLDLVRRLVRRKRRDIAITLGFPSAVAGLAVNALERFARSALTVWNIDALRVLLTHGDTLTRKRIAHSDCINEMFLSALSDPDIHPALTSSLLDELSKPLDEELLCDTPVGVLQDAARMLAARGAPLPRLRSVAAVCELHDAEVEHLRRTTPRGLRIMPEPPVPEMPRDGIEYIANSDELMLESDRMHNCAASYEPLIQRGEVFLYRVISPERCTLAIALGRGMRFHIRELKKANNEEPHSFWTVKRIEQWLKDNHDPAAVARVVAMQEAAQLRRWDPVWRDGVNHFLEQEDDVDDYPNAHEIPF